jgi:hypothetical protein
MKAKRPGFLKSSAKVVVFKTTKGIHIQKILKQNGNNPSGRVSDPIHGFKGIS